MAITVQIDAAKTHRGLVASAPAKRRILADPKLLFWRRLIDSAVADAKRTYAGIPTDSAILSRWWIEEHKPDRSDKAVWAASFESACNWLNLDADGERVEILARIEAAHQSAFVDHVRMIVYQRRAAVLSCAGIPTLIAKRFVLPLVSEADYEQVAGIEFPDPVGSAMTAEEHMRMRPMRRSA